MPDGQPKLIVVRVFDMRHFSTTCLIAATLALTGCVTTSTESTSDRRAWIVYQSETGLHRVLPDGSEDQTAAGEPSNPAFHPDFSRDGLRLVFVMDEADGTRDIWTSTWDGGDARRVVDCRVPCRDVDFPAWSPDGSRIAYTQIDNVDGHNPGSKLQAVDPATGAVETLASTEGADYLSAPRWSPDGASIVIEVTRYIDDGNDTTEITGKALAVVDLAAASPRLRLIQEFDSFATYPDWHPTDDLIVFAQGGSDPLDPDEPPQNLFTIHPDGTQLHQVTHQGPDDDGLWMPAFSSSNDEILATRVGRPGAHLTVVSVAPDGTVRDLRTPTSLSGAHARERPVPASS